MDRRKYAAQLRRLSGFDWRDCPVVDSWGDFLWLRKWMRRLPAHKRSEIEWYLARADLAWLLFEVLTVGRYIWDGTGGVMKPEWIFDRCRDVQGKCDQVVDIWARFHWKSLIKTFAKSIQEGLRDSNVTLVIFSHTRPIAKQFLRQIQMEMKGNPKLQHLSYDPHLGRPTMTSRSKDYLSDSLDAGLTLPRTLNPKEATFSAFGLVDSLPTSGHWLIRVLDDAVTKDTVTTREQIAKTAEAWELSQPLGMPTGRNEEWVSGTWYALGDLYHLMAKRGYEIRLHPCHEIDEVQTQRRPDGSLLSLVLDKSKPVLYANDKLERFLVTMGAKEGSKSARMQLYCDPNAGDTEMSFKLEWLQFYDPEEETARELAQGAHLYGLVDPARDRAHGHDFTAMWVIACRDDGKIYVLDIVRDMLNLTERTRMLFSRQKKWRMKEVRYERYGMQADIEHIEDVQRRDSFRFRIVEVAGGMEKTKRIERLLPFFEEGRIILPKKFMYKIGHTGESVDLVELFIEEEYLGFPNVTHNDLLDALSRLCDKEGRMNRRVIPLRLRYPEAVNEIQVNTRRVPDRKFGGRSESYGALVA